MACKSKGGKTTKKGGKKGGCKKQLKTEDEQVCLIKITSLFPMSNYKNELAKVYEAHVNKN